MSQVIITTKLQTVVVFKEVIQAVINRGMRGQSAYDTWLSLGNLGTPEDFIASLQGADGEDGLNGKNADGLTSFPVALSNEDTALTTGLKATFHIPYGFEMTDIFIGVTDIPTGAPLIVDVKENGVSIFGATKLQIDAGKETSIGSAIPYAWNLNNFLSDKSKMTAEVLQIGSANAGKGLKLYIIGYVRSYNDADLTPTLTATFDEMVAKYTQLRSFDFGTSKVSSGKMVAIPDAATAEQYWQYKSANAGLIVINREDQDFQPITDPTTHAFEADCLSLTANFPDPTQPGYQDFNLTAPIVRSRRVPLADTSQIKIGQVVGIPGENFQNFYRTSTASISGVVATGDKIVMTVSASDNSWTTTVTGEALAGWGPYELANAMVEGINNNPILQENGVGAAHIPNCPGAYLYFTPSRAIDVEQEFGAMGQGSRVCVGASNVVTGAFTWASPIQRFYQTFVIDKGADWVDLNHPMTIGMNETFRVSPARFIPIIERKPSGSGNPFKFAPGLIDGLELGQIMHLGYNDPTVRRVTSFGAANELLTNSGSSYAFGSFIGFVPKYWILTTGAPTNGGFTLPMASIPAGVKVGNVIRNFYGNPYSDGQIKITDITGLNITVDKSVAGWGTGSTIIIQSPCHSGQLWSRFAMSPSFDKRPYLAVEFYCKDPCSQDFGAFPAKWRYPHTSDPNPKAGVTGNQEIDFNDAYGNFYNDTLNRIFLGVFSAPGGTARAGGGASDALLALTANDQPGSYIGMEMRITGGTGNGQIRTITGYDPDLKKVTVSVPWVTVPNATSVYTLNPVVIYSDPNYSTTGLLGNNLGIKWRKIQVIETINRIYLYVDGKLYHVRACTSATSRRGQYSVDLACGTTKDGLFTNGLQNIDMSRFPIKYKIGHIKFWSAPNTLDPNILAVT